MVLIKGEGRRSWFDPLYATEKKKKTTPILDFFLAWMIRSKKKDKVTLNPGMTRPPATIPPTIGSV